MPNLTPFVVNIPSLQKNSFIHSLINALCSVRTCEMLNQMLNLSRIFDCFSPRFDKLVFNSKPSNLVDSDVSSQSSYPSNVKIDD